MNCPVCVSLLLRSRKLAKQPSQKLSVVNLVLREFVTSARRRASRSRQDENTERHRRSADGADRPSASRPVNATTTF